MNFISILMICSNRPIYSSKRSHRRPVLWISEGRWSKKNAGRSKDSSRKRGLWVHWKSKKWWRNCHRSLTMRSSNQTSKTLPRLGLSAGATSPPRFWTKVLWPTRYQSSEQGKRTRCKWIKRRRAKAATQDKEQSTSRTHIIANHPRSSFKRGTRWHRLRRPPYPSTAPTLMSTACKSKPTRKKKPK